MWQVVRGPFGLGELWSATRHSPFSARHDRYLGFSVRKYVRYRNWKQGAYLKVSEFYLSMILCHSDNVLAVGNRVSPWLGFHHGPIESQATSLSFYMILDHSSSIPDGFDPHLLKNNLQTASPAKNLHQITWWLSQLKMAFAAEKWQIGCQGVQQLSGVGVIWNEVIMNSLSLYL